jgi:hypothetical protein
MKTLERLLTLGALGTAAGFGISPAAELKPATCSAWPAYVRTADARMQTRLNGAGRFLWIDDEPGRAVRIHSGAILVAPGFANGTSGQHRHRISGVGPWQDCPAQRSTDSQRPLLGPGRCTAEPGIRARPAGDRQTPAAAGISRMVRPASTRTRMIRSPRWSTLC